MKRLLALLLGAFLLCVGTAQAAGPKVKTGIEVLRDRGFDALEGKRVGLVTNPSGVDSQLRSTIDKIGRASCRERVFV